MNKVTIYDIAAKSGFSKSTVSRVLMGDKKVKPDTREAITKVMEDMNYQPNRLAKSLSEGQLKIILVIVGDIMNEYYIRAVQTIERELYNEGYMVVVCNSDYNPQKELQYIRFANEFRFSGIILMTANNSDELRDLIKHSTCPVVLQNRYIPGMELDAIVLDNVRGGYMATKYLLDQGHKNIHIITGPIDSVATIDRRTGYINAMQEAGLTVRDDMIHASDLYTETNIELASSFVKEKWDATAVFCASVTIAYGFYEGLIKQGLNIPEDISLVGYDLMSSNGNLFPITAVGRLPEEMSLISVEALINRITDPTLPTRAIFLDPQLHKGKSVKNI